MKNFYFLLSASLLITSCGPTTVIQSDSYQPAPSQPVEDLSYQSFYDQLSPYGSWINYPGYGYVWMPNAGPDFRPYSTNGNWIYTDAGWTWASNYSWGWAPFHYGRWFYEGGYGWMWMPGNEWAPAWVSWRGSGDYYGWAPMGPRVTVDVALNSYSPPSNYWNFVPRQYIGNPGWHNYNVDVSRNVTIINNTTIINNYSGTNRSRYAFAPGPDPNEVRRISGNNFAQVQLRTANTPGERVSGSQYSIYQPRVSAVPATRTDAPGRPSTPAPAHYETFNNLHPSAQYPNYNQSNNNSHPVNENRPETENRTNNQPINSQPAYNNRPVTQNPAYSQPNNNRPTEQNNKPVEQNPGYSQPAGQNHQNSQAVNGNPAYNGRPSTQNPVNNQPVQTNPVVNPGANGNNHPGQSQTTLQHSQNTTASQTSNANHTQTTGRPSDNHNPNNVHPQQKQVPNNKPAPKKVAPDQKPVENPKTREAGNN
jgi:hypothetical protein